MPAVLLVCIQIVRIDVDYVTSLWDVLSQHRYKMDPLVHNADL